MLLSKGFEVEMYTGTPQGEIVGFSDRISANLQGFVREPDSRNVEYTTPPLCRYEKLLCCLLRPRRALRQYLQTLGDYTLVPGSTLSLGRSDRFYRSDPLNPYHTYIEQTYHTDVVTASIHINVGIPDMEALMRALRLVRLEAPLYLALSASSPFLDSQVTGSHSTRWQMFPQTPSRVPLFESHERFIRWTEEQLVAGTMQNVRHLWCSVRANGDCRPYRLNRLELRICDLVTDPIALLAVTALLEARIWQIIQNPDFEPLRQSSFSPEALLDLTAANEAAAARDSLDAKLQHWQDGRSISAHDWIEELYREVRPLAREKAFACFLSPLKKILTEGNQAQQWLQQYERGIDPAAIVTRSIADMERQERVLEQDLCEPIAA